MEGIAESAPKGACKGEGNNFNVELITQKGFFKCPTWLYKETKTMLKRRPHY